jgi:hypothetical protein
MSREGRDTQTTGNSKLKDYFRFAEQHPRLWFAARSAKDATRRPFALAKLATSKLEIDRYLRSTDSPRIILGAGSNRCAGWLSTDVVPSRGQVYLDVSRPFPFPDASVDFYHSEHMIEHLGYYAALGMAREMRRTLRRAGVARIATPDLAKIAALVVETSNSGQIHVSEANRLWSSRIDARVNGSMPMPYHDRASFVLNRLFYGWGHRFLFDRPTLDDLLRRAGFGVLHWLSADEPGRPELSGIDARGTHGNATGRRQDALQRSCDDFVTMVVEASTSS